MTTVRDLVEENRVSTQRINVSSDPTFEATTSPPRRGMLCTPSQLRCEKLAQI
jgi:hypothetical protein